MASTVALHCPGRNGVFIKGIMEKGWGWTGKETAGSFFTRRRSSGLSASAGIAQALPNFCAPGMRPSVHNFWARRREMFHFSAASRTVM